MRVLEYEVWGEERGGEAIVAGHLIVKHGLVKSPTREPSWW